MGLQSRANKNRTGLAIWLVRIVSERAIQSSKSTPARCSRAGGKRANGIRLHCVETKIENKTMNTLNPETLKTSKKTKEKNLLTKIH